MTAAVNRHGSGTAQPFHLCLGNGSGRPVSLTSLKRQPAPRCDTRCVQVEGLPPYPCPYPPPPWLLEAPVTTIILQMHTPACTSQCWSRQTQHGLRVCIWMHLVNGMGNNLSPGQPTLE